MPTILSILKHVLKLYSDILWKFMQQIYSKHDVLVSNSWILNIDFVLSQAHRKKIQKLLAKTRRL